MNIRHTPDTVAAPFGPYSHAVEVPEGSRLLYISGEVSVLPDGAVPEGIEAQAEACWRNIIAILADAGMGTPLHPKKPYCRSPGLPSGCCYFFEPGLGWGCTLLQARQSRFRKAARHSAAEVSLVPSECI